MPRHRDWQPGTGTAAYVEVRPREDPRRRLRVKNQQFRRIYISESWTTLYGEYLFMPAELGIDFADEDPVFINVFRGESAGRYRRISMCHFRRGSQ